MDRIQYLVDLYMPYLSTVWILCVLCACIFVLSLGIYIVANVGKIKYSKINILLLCNTIYFISIYLVIWLTNLEFTWLESIVLDVFVLGVSAVLYICFYIVQCVIMGIVKLIKRIKNKKVKVKKDTQPVTMQVSQKVQNDTSGTTYTITKEVSRFTSNYLKSFMRPGVPINRLQIMIDNKENYITKLSEHIGANTNTDTNMKKVAEFYYNYYVKIFSE